ncbi:glycoside hydrolase family 97 C-terminal domain-containing protein [Luteimonas kalidii]|uniref:Glycosyl-hydrolase 97 C-terminal oligomerisation domain-containing protein n=1 Tax=Luteimonas kalidii TaxID=3042025 RepID=A0ABT6JY40_9GAMM|nr:glycoside hydrolase family 97 C-terminal domain-containing protein [Luteimonas kalidii]MDH5835499.1 hypothetical protein [Luteimonas kalidii]
MIGWTRVRECTDVASTHVRRPAADDRGKREDIVIETREVTRDEVLAMRLAPGGGQAIRFAAH